jgi:hypothetical protein
MHAVTAVVAAVDAAFCTLAVLVLHLRLHLFLLQLFWGACWASGGERIGGLCLWEVEVVPLERWEVPLEVVPVEVVPLEVVPVEPVEVVPVEVVEPYAVLDPAAATGDVDPVEPAVAVAAAALASLRLLSVSLCLLSLLLSLTLAWIAAAVDAAVVAVAVGAVGAAVVAVVLAAAAAAVVAVVAAVSAAAHRQRCRVVLALAPATLFVSWERLFFAALIVFLVV